MGTRALRRLSRRSSRRSLKPAERLRRRPFATFSNPSATGRCRNCICPTKDAQSRPDTGADDWSRSCSIGERVPGTGKRFVYVLRSDSDPTRHYVGSTSDVASRLEWHNFGPDGQTRRHRPWKPIVVIEFSSESVAIRFERYLKSGSGRAFARRHFDPDMTVFEN